MFKILVINPGSTSTKLALFNDIEKIFDKCLHHPVGELSGFARIVDQFEYRLEWILKLLKDENISLQDIDAYVGRGGLLKAIPGGTYKIDNEMLKDLRSGVQGEHASNLGGILANALAQKYNKPAFIVDPVVVDELDEAARLSGHPQLTRKSIFHALNHKAVARKTAALLNKEYKNVNLIVAHLGGGISVAAHKKGRVVDVNNALDGEGPYSPERSGTLPAGDLVRLCFSGKFEQQQILKMITGKGGIVAYLGTNDIKELQDKIRNKKDRNIEKILDGMVYQISKEIVSLAAVLKGKIDAIVLTGGIANNKLIIKQIKERISFLAPVYIFPGEEEMEALAHGVFRILSGQEKAKIYAKEVNQT